MAPECEAAMRTGPQVLPSRPQDGRARVAAEGDGRENGRVVKTRSLVRAAALVLLATFSAACGRGGGGEGAVTIAFPAGVAAPAVAPSAKPITDLTPLRAYEDGGGLVAAATCEPSGVALPAGTKMSWALPSPRAPGETLFVVVLDPAGKRWLDTGDTAVVLPGGFRAEGVVSHFSTRGLSATKPKASEGAAPPPGVRRDTDPEKEPVKEPGSEQVVHGTLPRVLFGTAKVVERAKMVAVKKAYDAWSARAGEKARMDRATMQEIYGAGDFATVKAVIENGGIAATASLQMADLRSAMILEVTAEIAKANGWKVVRSDSGNQASGMKSDIDQTVYVYERDGKGGWKRSEAGDVEFIRQFREQFPGRTGFSLESLDVATIAGRDKFPDPRRTSVQLDAEGLRKFSAHAAETMVALRLTPGAYTYCGAVVQQMQLRAEAAIDEMLRGQGKAPKPPREAHPELAGLLGENGVNNLVCLEVGPDEKGTWGVHEMSKEGAKGVMFDALPPALRPGHAYDAAVANYLEFMHHLKDAHPAVKYVLRAIDDGLRTAHWGRTGERLGEYASIPEGERAAHLTKLFGGDPTLTENLARWKSAFDVSAALREAHKGGLLTDAEFDKALLPMAAEIAKERGGTPESNLKAARKEYDARCQEFLVKNAIATASQRVMEFATFDPADPSKRPRIVTDVDEGRIRESLGLDAPEKASVWEQVKQEVFKNEADLARLQLLYSFKEMRPDVADKVVEQAKAKGLSAAELEKVKGLVAESKEWGFAWKRYREYPDLYHEYYRAVGRLAARRTVDALKESLLLQSGWIDTDAGRVRNPRVQAFLDGVKLGGLDERLRGYFAKNRAAGITSRWIRNAVLDVGNYAGVLNVIRVYSETGGDPDATAEAMVKEAVSVLPVVGQVYTLSQSETVGQAALSGGVMITCILVPQAGIAALVFNVGEAGVAIYESEFVRPLQDTVADALYHGWVGPSQRSYDRAPAQFTEDDAKALQSAQAGVYEWGGGKDPQAQREYLTWATKRHALRAKRAAWEAYDTERRRAPAWEKMGIREQRLLACPTILDRVEPVVFYGPPDSAGPVDFAAKPLSSEEEARRKALDKRLDVDEVDGVAWQDEIAEYGALESRRKAAERAEGYRREAARHPELMHQIRLDSLWPWMERAHERAMVDARAFATSWCAANKDAAVAELVRVGVLPAGTTDLPAAAVEELGMRFLDDVARSRDLWHVHDLVGRGQKKAEEDRLERRKGAWFTAALAEAARRGLAVLPDGVRAALSSAGLVPDDAASLSPLAQAIEDRHLPEGDVEVKVSLRKVPILTEGERGAGKGGGQDGSMAEPAKDGGEKREEYEFRPDVRVTADPRIWKPPYRTAWWQVDPEAARAAAGSGSFKGLPLGDDAKKAIAEYLKKVGPADASKKTVDPIVLVFAFCDGVEIPKRVVPETTAGLVVPPKVTIPDHGGEAYLLGAAAIAPAPEPVPEGDLTMAPLVSPQSSIPMFEITSAALRKLDPAHPDAGLRFRLLRAKSEEGPYEPISEKAWPLDVFPDTTVAKVDPARPTEVSHARVAPDVVRLHDGYVDRDSPGGMWYVAEQVGIVRQGREDPRPKGDPVRSKPVGPGPPTVVLRTPGGGSGPPSPPWSEGTWYFNVSVGYEKQNWLRAGVEIVVRDRMGERHYWTPRNEGDVKVGYYDSSYGAAACWAFVGAGGGTVSAKTAAGGQERTFESGSSPGAVESARKEAEDAKGSLERALARAEAEDAASREVIAKAKPWITAAPSDSKPDTRSGWAWEVTRDSDERTTARMDLELYHPKERNRQRIRLALAQGNPRAALAPAKEDVEIARRLKAIRADQIAVYAKAAASVEGLEAPDGGMVFIVRDSLATMKAQHETWERDAERSEWLEVAKIAWLAADTAAFTEAMEAALRLSDRPSEKKERAGVIHSTVKEYVALTRDRKRGAALLREQEAIESEGKSAEDRKNQALLFRDQLPSWWPEGDLPPAQAK